jgi:hypothetical protein
MTSNFTLTINSHEPTIVVVCQSTWSSDTLNFELGPSEADQAVAKSLRDYPFRIERTSGTQDEQNYKFIARNMVVPLLRLTDGEYMDLEGEYEPYHFVTSSPLERMMCSHVDHFQVSVRLQAIPFSNLSFDSYLSEKDTI